jgi:hypothetical protein
MLATASVLSACQDTSGPGRAGEFDAARANADHKALGTLLGSPSLSSLGALGGRVPAGALGITGAANREAGSVPLISEENRGATFVYDAAKNEYVKHPTRTGAPSNGVRFVLYATLGDGKPDPARETGYADLTDLGNTSDDAVALRLVGVNNGLTFVDYAFRADPGENSGEIEIEGFLQNEADKLDFDIQASGEERGANARLDVGFRLEIDSRDFMTEGGVEGVKNDGREHGDLDLLVRHRDDSIRVDATGLNDRIDASFFVNDGLFATAVGPQGSPEIRGANGRELTGPEMLALAHIVGITAHVFKLVECLAEPVEDLIGLGVVL